MIILSVILMSAGVLRAELQDEGQIGWVKSDSKESYVSFHFISDNGSPAYVKVIGPSSYDACYIPLDKMNDFRKYLQNIYKTVLELDKDKENLPDTIMSAPIMVKKPAYVWMSSTYNLHHKEDREIKGPCDLSATWEYYPSSSQPTGSYIAVSAAIPSRENPAGYNKFKIWVTLDEINYILKKIISANEIFKWENHVAMRNSEKNRNATDMSRRLQSH